jgi:hypothetical protein
LHVTPAKPCALVDCTAELHVQLGHDSMRVHLDDELRRGLIEALGGEVR